MKNSVFPFYKSNKIMKKIGRPNGQDCPQFLFLDVSSYEAGVVALPSLCSKIRRKRLKFYGELTIHCQFK